MEEQRPKLIFAPDQARGGLDDEHRCRQPTMAEAYETLVRRLDEDFGTINENLKVLTDRDNHFAGLVGKDINQLTILVHKLSGQAASLREQSDKHEAALAVMRENLDSVVGELADLRELVRRGAQ